MKYLFSILLLAPFSGLVCQTFEYPAIRSAGHASGEFVPEGWAILDSAIGDLNQDDYEDWVLVMQHIDSVPVINDNEDTVLAQPRMLVILFGDSTQNFFTLARQSNSFILMNNEPNMEDRYQGIEIFKGVLQISFQIFFSRGSWYMVNSTYTFRFQNGEFQLIVADYSSIHRATLDYKDYSYYFLKQKRKLKAGNERKKKEKVAWKRLPVEPLKNFDTFSRPFSWAIEEEVLL